MPALSASPVQQQEAKQEKKTTGRPGGPEPLAYLRQMNALKLEMKKAVHQENFERAAELRDQIRSLEAAHKEQKENK
ncbi:MAG: UvrB/UvrC motif-containing protein [Dysosmobacter welbionis]